MAQNNTRMSMFARLVFWYVAANALLGALILILFPSQTDTLFFWTIKPPINAALFGALYLGGAVTVAWVSYRGEWEPARFLIPVLVSAGFFISLTTLMHLDRFAPGIKLVYWLVIYIGAPLLALYFYVDQERRGANWTVAEPITPATRWIAIVTGAVVLLLGIVLLVAPDAALPYWPWPTTPLMIRIFASWFCAFGVGLIWFHFDRDWERVHYIAKLMVAAAVLDLLMVFVHRDDITLVGINLWVYCFHLTAFGLVGLLMHWLQRKARLAVRPAVLQPQAP